MAYGANVPAGVGTGVGAGAAAGGICGVGGFTSTGVILVLFILLVIITGTFF